MAACHAVALAELRQSDEQLCLALDSLQSLNAAEHARLSREAEQAMARITAGGHVLDHVRQLIGFFKSA